MSQTGSKNFLPMLWVWIIEGENLTVKGADFSRSAFGSDLFAGTRGEKWNTEASRFPPPPYYGTRWGLFNTEMVNSDPRGMLDSSEGSDNPRHYSHCPSGGLPPSISERVASICAPTIPKLNSGLRRSSISSSLRYSRTFSCLFRRARNSIPSR